jgi:hypothetical protein
MNSYEPGTREETHPGPTHRRATTAAAAACASTRTTGHDAGASPRVKTVYVPGAYVLAVGAYAAILAIAREHQVAAFSLLPLLAFILACGLAFLARPDKRTHGLPKRELPTVTVAEPVVGWRAWWFKNGHLVSLNVNDAWPYGEPFVADCLPSAQGMQYRPVGIHAWRTEDDLRTWGRHTLGCEIEKSPFVYGAVLLGGEVIAHERGYRAELAYPQTVYVPQTIYPYGEAGAPQNGLLEADKIARWIESHYGCEANVARPLPDLPGAA